LPLSKVAERNLNILVEMALVLVLVGYRLIPKFRLPKFCSNLNFF